MVHLDGIPGRPGPLEMEPNYPRSREIAAQGDRRQHLGLHALQPVPRVAEYPGEVSHPARYRHHTRPEAKAVAETRARLPRENGGGWKRRRPEGAVKRSGRRRPHVDRAADAG